MEKHTVTDKKKEDAITDEKEDKRIIDECLKMNYKVYDRLAEI